MSYYIEVRHNAKIYQYFINTHFVNCGLLELTEVKPSCCKSSGKLEDFSRNSCCARFKFLTLEPDEKRPFPISENRNFVGKQVVFLYVQKPVRLTPARLPVPHGSGEKGSQLPFYR